MNMIIKTYGFRAVMLRLNWIEVAKPKKENCLCRIYALSLHVKNYDAFNAENIISGNVIAVLQNP